MPIESEFHSFTKLDVKVRVSEIAGVYGLYVFGDSPEKSKPTETLYYGQSENLRGRLLRHLTDNDLPEATRFSFELSLKPETREAELHAAYKAVHGKLPRGNTQDESLKLMKPVNSIVDEFDEPDQ